MSVRTLEINGPLQYETETAHKGGLDPAGEATRSVIQSLL